MGSVLARAKAHFGSRRSISIPEWKDENGNPTVLYWTPFTVDEQAKMKAARDAAEDDATDAMLRVIITKARDAEGKKVFDIGDRPELRVAVDAMVLDRIMAAMMSTDSLGDAEKN
jgi:hypothetical protein